MILLTFIVTLFLLCIFYKPKRFRVNGGILSTLDPGYGMLVKTDGRLALFKLNQTFQVNGCMPIVSGPPGVFTFPGQATIDGITYNYGQTIQLTDGDRSMLLAPHVFLFSWMDADIRRIDQTSNDNDIRYMETTGIVTETDIAIKEAESPASIKLNEYRSKKKKIGTFFRAVCNAANNNYIEPIANQIYKIDGPANLEELLRRFGISEYGLDKILLMQLRLLSSRTILPDNTLGEPIFGIAYGINQGHTYAKKRDTWYIFTEVPPPNEFIGNNMNKYQKPYQPDIATKRWLWYGDGPFACVANIEPVAGQDTGPSESGTKNILMTSNIRIMPDGDARNTHTIQYS